MIPDPGTLAVFALASLALAVVPGPAVLYIVAQSVHGGRRAGVVSALGVATGGMFHVLAAVVGLSAVLAASAEAFTVVKILGAAYLIWLGIRTLLSADDRIGGRGAEPTLASTYGRGVVVNVLNPKTALFFLAFLPQFVDPSRVDRGQLAVLGAVFVAIALASDLVWALVAGTAGAGFSEAPDVPADPALRLRDDLRRARRPRRDRKPLALASSPAVDRDRQLESDVVAARDLGLEPLDQLDGAGGSRDQPALDLLGRVEHDELLLERPREAAVPEVPAVELLQEPAGAALAELPHRLADEQDELRDDLLARRLAPAAVHDLLEHPRVALGGASDHHGSRARGCEHRLRLRARDDVAGSHDGDVDERDELRRSARDRPCPCTSAAPSEDGASTTPRPPRRAWARRRGSRVTRLGALGAA